MISSLHPPASVCDLILVFPGLGDSGIFKDKTDFKTLTRLAYCQCRLRKVFGAVFTRFQWTSIALVVDRGDLHASVLGETLDVGLRKAKIYPNVIKFFGSQRPDKAKILREASENSRSKFQHKRLLVFSFCEVLLTHIRAVACGGGGGQGGQLPPLGFPVFKNNLLLLLLLHLVPVLAQEALPPPPPAYLGQATALHIVQ